MCVCVWGGGGCRVSNKRCLLTIFIKICWWLCFCPINIMFELWIASYYLKPLVALVDIACSG